MNYVNHEKVRINLFIRSNHKKFEVLKTKLRSVISLIIINNILRYKM